MLSVLVVGIPPSPARVYVGILRTLETRVADPLEPVVVRDVILFVYAVSQLLADVVVGIT